MRQLYQQHTALFYSLIACNIALTLWCVASDPIINYDGITYIGAAELFKLGDWRAALDYYHWPFYSLAIAGVSKVLFINSEIAAHVVNSLFIISLCFAYLAIVADLSGSDKRLLLIAALVIVWFPSISKYRTYITRDFAYLSFYLWSLRYLLCYCRADQKRVLDLVRWLVFAMLAILFRLEGVVFVLLTPYFLYYLQSDRRNLKLLTVAVVVTGVVMAWWYLQQKYLPTMLIDQGLAKNVNALWDVYVMQMISQTGNESLNLWQMVTLTAGNIGDVMYQLVHRLNVFYLVIVVLAYQQKRVWQDVLSRRVWLLMVALNLALLIAYSLFNNFFVGRYTLTTALTLLILAPFGIDWLWQNLRHFAVVKQGLSALLLVALVVASIEGLDVRTNKQHFKEAGAWLAQNVTRSESIYSNNRLLMYYADRGVETDVRQDYSNQQMQRMVDKGHSQNFQYLVLCISQGNSQEESFLTLFTRLYGQAVYHKQQENTQKRAVYVFKTTS